MHNKSVKNVSGRRPHTFLSLLLRNLGPQTFSGHNLCAIWGPPGGFGQSFPVEKGDFGPVRLGSLMTSFRFLICFALVCGSGGLWEAPGRPMEGPRGAPGLSLKQPFCVLDFGLDQELATKLL